MNLSAPIYRLKRDAKLLSRQSGIPLNEALNRVAEIEGFSTWSLLAAKHAVEPASEKLYRMLSPGNMVLIAARPGHGKTLFSIELLISAIRNGHTGSFFSLECTRQKCDSYFTAVGHDRSTFGERFIFNGSEAISSGYIMDQMKDAAKGDFLVIDYLQLLDQDRRKPELRLQVAALHHFAKERDLIVTILSQVDRNFDPARQSMPSTEDVRLANPVNLHLFTHKCVLHNGEIQIVT